MSVRTLITGLTAMALSAVAVPHAVNAQDHGSVPGQSIQVHGHWIIEIYDGEELVERREFENALSNGADVLIADILSGEASVGSWIVVLGNDCSVYGGSTYSCNLPATATSPVDGDHAGALVLEAATTITTDGSLSDDALALHNVSTAIGTCGPGTAPENCTETESGGFTHRVLETPIPVEPDQDVNVTVIISFASG